MVGKKDIVKEVSRKLGIDKADISFVLGSIVDTICENIEDGQDVVIRGLGTFKFVERKEGKRFNIAIGDVEIMPKHRKLTFVQSQRIKAASIIVE